MYPMRVTILYDEMAHRRVQDFVTRCDKLPE